MEEEIHPISVVIKDRRGIIVGLNESARRVFGDVIGQHTTTILGGEMGIKAAALDESVVYSKVPHLNFVNTYHSPFHHTLRWTRSDVYPLFDLSVNVVGVAIYAFDVTDEVANPDSSHLFKLLSSSSHLLNFVLKSIKTDRLDEKNRQRVDTAKSNFDAFSSMLSAVTRQHSASSNSRGQKVDNDGDAVAAPKPPEEVDPLRRAQSKLPTPLITRGLPSSSTVSSSPHSSSHDSPSQRGANPNQSANWNSSPVGQSCSPASDRSSSNDRVSSNHGNISSGRRDSIDGGQLQGQNRRFYFGSTFLRVMAFYAEMRESEPIPPLMSVEIAPDANFFCIGNSVFLEFLLRHSVEIAIQCVPYGFLVKAFSEEGKLKIVILFREPFNDACVPHLRACSELAKITGCDFIVSRTPLGSQCKIQIPTYDHPLYSAPLPSKEEKPPSINETKSASSSLKRPREADAPQPSDSTV